MSDVEKVICTGDGGCNAGELAALMNNNNNQWNNPFIYLVWMMMLGRNGLWGGNAEGVQNAEIMAKLNDLGAQAGANQNTNLMMDAINGNHEALHSLSTNLGVGISQLQGAICGVQNAITQVGGQVGMTGQQVINSVLLGNKDLTAALQSCCCENKQLVTTMGYEGQIRDLQNTSAIQSRIDQLANGVQQGFSQVGYAAAQNTNSIIQAGNANTQRIIDTMNAHWSSDLQQKYQDARLELSQKSQNEYLISQLKATCGCNCN